MFKVWQNNKTSFSVHNEMMKQFRRSHGKVVTLNTAEVHEPDIISRTEPLLIKCVYLDNGGLYHPEQTMGRFICPPLPKIAGYKISSN